MLPPTLTITSNYVVSMKGGERVLEASKLWALKLLRGFGGLDERLIGPNDHLYNDSQTANANSLLNLWKPTRKIPRWVLKFSQDPHRFEKPLKHHDA